MNLTLKDIQTAADRLRGNLITTPCSYSQTLSKVTGAEVYLEHFN